MIPERFPENFLRDYWQRNPLLIRQAFPEFTAELDIDDIAGLACDELAESRLISGSYPEHDWALRYGPFSEQDFDKLADRNWTLLVQDVEKHYPPLQSLLETFSFLPSWRIDDLMVSVAAPGGSVGPHVDQYDVFLLQATGRRKWQTASSFDPTLLPDCELSVLKSFEAEQEWVLEPGDMLYLPPGVAHHGVALDPGMAPCMTWSIGMRAPSSADILQSLGEWLATNGEEGERYRDENLAAELHAGEIDTTAIEGLRKLVNRAASDEAGFRAFTGGFLSRYRLAHDPAPPEHQIDIKALYQDLGRGAQLRHNPWTRLLWLQTKSGAALFAAGEEFHCSRHLAQAICSKPVGLVAGTVMSDEAADLVCELLNRGHLYLAFPED
jgi:50S ribosomal protein L16 3-hydroxylase